MQTISHFKCSKILRQIKTCNVNKNTQFVPLRKNIVNDYPKIIMIIRNSLVGIQKSCILVTVVMAPAYGDFAKCSICRDLHIRFNRNSRRYSNIKYRKLKLIEHRIRGNWADSPGHISCSKLVYNTILSHRLRDSYART